jgi:hypothetical protein
MYASVGRPMLRFLGSASIITNTWFKTANKVSQQKIFLLAEAVDVKTKNLMNNLKRKYSHKTSTLL